MSTINLRAYRFSAEELEKMQWLKKLFEDNVYAFDPNRFPEVYYDTFDRAAEVFPFLRENHFAEDTPDYLGVYIPFAPKGYAKESKEGIVILFSDRIARFSGLKGLSVDAVRYVVLMHELGHWFTHWSLKSGSRWTYGYSIPTATKKVHEGLADLIAYWSSEHKEDFLDALYALTPKDTSGAFDLTNNYGCYLEMTGISKALVLKKLSEVRKYSIVKDDILFEFLKEPVVYSFEIFFNEKNYSKSPPDLLEESSMKAMFETGEWSEELQDELDFQKMVEMEIIQIKHDKLLDFLKK